MWLISLPCWRTTIQVFFFSCNLNSLKLSLNSYSFARSVLPEIFILIYKNVKLYLQTFMYCLLGCFLNLFFSLKISSFIKFFDIIIQDQIKQILRTHWNTIIHCCPSSEECVKQAINAFKVFYFNLKIHDPKSSKALLFH